MLKIHLEELSAVGDGQTYIPQYNIFLFYQVHIMWVCFCLSWGTQWLNILTFITVFLHTGTNFPAVSVNYLLAVAMMKNKQRWNDTRVPTQSQPQTVSRTLWTWNNSKKIEEATEMFFAKDTRLVKYRVCRWYMVEMWVLSVGGMAMTG